MMTARVSSNQTDGAAVTSDMSETCLQRRLGVQQYQFMWAASEMGQTTNKSAWHATRSAES